MRPTETIRGILIIGVLRDPLPRLIRKAEPQTPLRGRSVLITIIRANQSHTSRIKRTIKAGTDGTENLLLTIQSRQKIQRTNLRMRPTETIRGILIIGVLRDPLPRLIRKAEPQTPLRGRSVLITIIRANQSHTSRIKRTIKAGTDGTENLLSRFSHARRYSAPIFVCVLQRPFGAS